jgi:nucleoside-diphosphate-sugar epimerase
MMRIALLGATSKTGRHVVARLCARGHAVRAIGRDATRLETLDARAERRVGDLADPVTLAGALTDVDVVASLAHARHVPALLQALPPPGPGPRLVLTGSVRIFTKLPDPAADAVRAGMAAFERCGRPGVVLLPSMIFGAPEERNVNRLIAFFRRLPAWLPVPVPLPDGGRHLVQPVYFEDMVAAFVAAIERPEADGPPIVVAGAEPIAYAEMVRDVARALGRRAIVIDLPIAALAGVLAALARLGVPLPFSADEIRRAGEDKRFDVSPLRVRLGVEPRSFPDGLAARLRRGG